MDTIFMNSGNSKTSDPHRLLLNFVLSKNVALSNLSIYYTWRIMKKPCKNGKFKISAPTWNEEFELLDG